MPSPRFKSRALKPASGPASASIRPPMQPEEHTSSATTSLPVLRADSRTGPASSGSTRPSFIISAEMPSCASSSAASIASFTMVPYTAIVTSAPCLTTLYSSAPPSLYSPSPPRGYLTATGPVSVNMAYSSMSSASRKDAGHQTVIPGTAPR